MAKRVRQFRESRGWTLERAAEAMDIEPAHVRRIESGKANPSLAVLSSVAAAFDMTVSQLLASSSRRNDTPDQSL